MCTGFDPWCSHVAWLQSPSRTGWFLPGLPDTMYISRFVPSVRSTRFHHDGAYRGLKCEHHCTLFVPRGSLRQYNAFAHAPNYPLESRKKNNFDIMSEGNCYQACFCYSIAGMEGEKANNSFTDCQRSLIVGRN